MKGSHGRSVPNKICFWQLGSHKEATLFCHFYCRCRCLSAHGSHTSWRRFASCSGSACFSAPRSGSACRHTPHCLIVDIAHFLPVAYVLFANICVARSFFDLVLDAFLCTQFVLEQPAFFMFVMSEDALLCACLAAFLEAFLSASLFLMTNCMRRVMIGCAGTSG